MKDTGEKQNWAAELGGSHRIPLLLLLSMFHCAAATHAQGQRHPDGYHPPGPVGPNASSENSPPAGGASITVCVVDEAGFPLDKQATVKLHDEVSERVVWASTAARSEARFDNVAAGQYEIETSAQGFRIVRQEFRAPTSNQAYRVWIALPRDVSGAVNDVRPGQILAPKPRKEVEKGMAAVKQGNLKEAQKHFEAAYKLAPTNPEVNYLLGVVFERQRKLADAEEYLRRAVSLDPARRDALMELERVQSERGDAAGATQMARPQ